jgi:hypothetical protein
MHTATLMPELADRNLREKWELEGSSTIHQRAVNKVLEILSKPNPAVFSAEIDAQIHAEFPGLVKGDSFVPEGWEKLNIGNQIPKRERRTNRRRKRA